MSPLSESPAESPVETGALLRRYMKGDASAFRDLVRRYYPLVFAAAMRRSEGRRALAEDAAQLVFIDLARRAPGLRADERLGGWLHQRAMRAASTLMRGEARRHARERRAAADGSISVNSNSESAAVYSLNENPLSQTEAASPAWQELAPHLDAALQRLSAADRDAVLLRCVEGRNFRAVGAALGLSDDAAQKRVSRALEKLRSILLKRRGTVPAISVLAAGLGADHAQASGCASILSGEPLRAAAAAMAKAGPVTWAARWLPQLKAAAAGSALACAVWVWPLIHEQQSLERSLSLSGQTGTNSGHSAAAADEKAIRFPVFPPLPKVAEEASVEEIVRGIAALAAGPYNELSADRFSDLLGHLKDGDRAATALRQIADTFAPALLLNMDRRYWRRYLLMNWAGKNPIAALDHVLAKIPAFWPGGRENPMDSTGGMGEVIQEILNEQKNGDPVRLSRWYADRMAANPNLLHGLRQREALVAVGQQLGGMAVSAHSTEALLILCRVENRLRIGLFDSIVDAAQDAESLGMLSSMAQNLGTPNQRAKLMDSVMDRLGNLDYEAGQGVVEKVGDLQRRLSWAAILAAPQNQSTWDGTRIPQDGRKSRADWWLSMSTPDLHDATAREIAEAWDSLDPAWSDQWLQQQISREAFLNFVRGRFQMQTVNRLWEMNLSKYDREMALRRLRLDASLLRRMDPNGGQAFIDQLEKLSALHFPDRPKIGTFLTP